MLSNNHIGKDIFESFVNDNNNTKEDIIVLTNLLINELNKNTNRQIISDLREEKEEYCESNYICPNCGQDLTIINKSQIYDDIDKYRRPVTQYIHGCESCGYIVK